MGRTSDHPVNPLDGDKSTSSIEFGVMAALVGFSVLIVIAIWSGALKDLWSGLKDLVFSAL